MKRIALLFAILATAIGATAQQETGSWSITPRVGVNSSVLTMDDVQYMNASGNIETSKAQHRWGLTAGVEAQYQCWSQIALSAGLMYSNEGCQYEKRATWASGSSHCIS